MSLIRLLTALATKKSRSDEAGEGPRQAGIGRYTVLALVGVAVASASAISPQRLRIMEAGVHIVRSATFSLAATPSKPSGEQQMVAYATTQQLFGDLSGSELDVVSKMKLAGIKNRKSIVSFKCVPHAVRGRIERDLLAQHTAPEVIYSIIDQIDHAHSDRRVIEDFTVDNFGRGYIYQAYFWLQRHEDREQPTVSVGLLVSSMELDVDKVDYYTEKRTPLLRTVRKSHPVTKMGMFGPYVVDEGYETQEAIPGEYTVRNEPVFKYVSFTPNDLEAYQQYLQYRIFKEVVLLHKARIQAPNKDGSDGSTLNA